MSTTSLEGDACSDDRRVNLIPIDHGYCLPDRFHVDPLDWCWYYWKQAKRPFSIETQKYVESVNVDEDADMLRRELNIDLASLRTMKISGRLMKIGVQAGLTLYEIAELIARDDMEKPSRLELTILEAISKARSKMMGQPLAVLPQVLPALFKHGEHSNGGRIELLNTGDISLCTMDDHEIQSTASQTPYSETMSPSLSVDASTFPVPPLDLSALSPYLQRTIRVPSTNEATREGDGCESLSTGCIKTVEVDEDITSSSTARVTPVESITLEKEDVRSPALATSEGDDKENFPCGDARKSSASSSNRSSPVSYSYNDLKEDLWNNAIFEKDFFRQLELLMERDVQSVLHTRTES